MDDCATLSVPQPDGDRDTNLALQEGWLGITYNDDGYGNAVRVTIEFLDQACIEHPVIGPIIDHVLPDALQDLDPDCTWFRSLLESGQLRVRGEPIRSDAVEGYLTRWCRASQS